jgi:hypothetical protein
VEVLHIKDGVVSVFNATVVESTLPLVGCTTATPAVATVPAATEIVAKEPLEGALTLLQSTPVSVKPSLDAVPELVQVTAVVPLLKLTINPV